MAKIVEMKGMRPAVMHTDPLGLMTAPTPNPHRGPMFEAEIFPNNMVELESKNSEEEWFRDTRYTELNYEDISTLLRFYDTDSDVRTTTHIYFSALFSGGVRFEREGGQYQMREDASHWYNTTWSEWGMAVDRLNFCIGFCACTQLPHSVYVGMPTCLEMSRCRILYRLDVYGMPHFVFFERQEMPNMQLYPRYIPNVIVYVESAPSASGALRSRLNTLIDDMELSVALFEAAKTAVAARSKPVLVLQTEKPKADQVASIESLNPHAESAMYGDGTAPYSDPGATDDSMGRGGYSTSTPAVRAKLETEERRKYEYSRYVAMMGPGAADRISAAARNWEELFHTTGLKTFPLPLGRTLARQTLAESPDQLFVLFRTARMERVLNSFGIPLGMISQTSSLGNGSKQAQNQEVFTIFVHTQKRKKEQLLSYMKDMYNRIYRVHHALQKLANTAKGQFRVSDATTDTKIMIWMPGLLEDVLLVNLFKMGVLTYEAYVGFMSEKYGIPLRCFNEKCEMSLEDLNGVKPTPEGAAGSAGKSSS